jgi:hypothetical protein
MAVFQNEKRKKKKRWYGILRGTNKGRRTIFIRRNSNQEKIVDQL